jgi:transcriptional regulator with XRE-family HTH domain
MPNSEVDRQKLGERLRQAREYLELSQDEVAKIMSVPRTAISLLESGQRRLAALELKKLAEIYKRPAAYFTEETEIAAAMPEDVAHLARAASKLSEQDRGELARFAEFLSARSNSRRTHAK